MKPIVRTVAELTDRLINWLWPASIHQQFDNAHILAVLEEQREVWEAGEFKTSAGAANPPVARRRQTPTTNPEFDDLPTMQVLSAAFDDDDVEFWSDLLYMRDLRTEIFAQAYGNTVRLTEMPQWPNTFDFKDIA